jgi:hypothetical protein
MDNVGGVESAMSVPDRGSIDPALRPPNPTSVISQLRHHFYTLILPPRQFNCLSTPYHIVSMILNFKILTKNLL